MIKILRIKKTTFFVRIFNITPCAFTQIPNRRARWMHNLIPHPTSTTVHTFDRPHYPKKKKYLKKCDDDIIITFFQVFLVFGVEVPFKSMPSGYSLDAGFNSNPKSSPDRNLSKNTRRYVKNMNKRSSFFYDTYPQIYIKNLFKR